MAARKHNKHFYTSLILHGVILFVLIAGFDFSTPLPVLENTNKNDVISAVVLGDTHKSKILPKPTIEPVKPKVMAEVPPKIIPIQKPTETLPPVKKDVIAIKVEPKKEKMKAKEKKISEDKLRKKKLADEFLADLNKIKKEVKKEKKVVQKNSASQFEKTLREQAEKSLRQQLLNEEIKLQGTQSRQAQGEVNKYKALILQAISERWIVPVQANKKLFCELMIRLAPGGMVIDVQVTKTSGDPSLDSSARAAVLKASPLPVPSDSNAFESFRQFVLKVKPENIIDSGLV